MKERRRCIDGYCTVGRERDNKVNKERERAGKDVKK